MTRALVTSDTTTTETDADAPRSTGVNRGLGILETDGLTRLRMCRSRQTGRSMVSKNTRIALSVGMLAILSTTGCAAKEAWQKIEYTALNPAPRQMVERTIAEVQMFATKPPSYPYIEVGRLTLKRGSEYWLRKAAAERGCEGLITYVADGAICIMFQQEPLPTPVAPPMTRI